MRLLLLSALTAVLATGCNTPHYQSDWQFPAKAEPLRAQGRAIPPGTFEGAQRSLLHEYQDRELVGRDEAATWGLSANAKRIVVALLIMAARDNYGDLDMVFTESARWGAPDRREYDALPIFAGDGGERFFEALRGVTSRFSDKASFTCPPMANGSIAAVRAGAEPMWCFYLSSDQRDILAFKLQVELGQAKIDYVGLYEERPVDQPFLRDHRGNASPPVNPPIKRRPAGEMPPIRMMPSVGPDGEPILIGPGGVPIPIGPGGAPIGPGGAPIPIGPGGAQIGPGGALQLPGGAPPPAPGVTPPPAPGVTPPPGEAAPAGATPPAAPKGSSSPAPADAVPTPITPPAPPM